VVSTLHDADVARRVQPASGCRWSQQSAASASARSTMQRTVSENTVSLKNLQEATAEALVAE